MSHVPGKQRMRRSAVLPLIDFLRPGHGWPYPHSIEQAFQLFRWMIATGKTYSESELGMNNSGVLRVLSGKTPSYHPNSVSPIQSLADLQSRFLYALFTGHGSGVVDRWREDHGINAYGSVTLPYPHYKPMSGVRHLGYTSESDVGKAVSHLLETPAGTRLAASLNSIHTKARTVHRVDIAVTAQGFFFKVHYGFKPSIHAKGGDSEWSQTLASTQGEEPFVETLARAQNVLARIKEEAFVLDLCAELAA